MIGEGISVNVRLIFTVDGTYRVGREKVREFARAVQNYHPLHWEVAAAAELGDSPPAGRLAR